MRQRRRPERGRSFVIFSVTLLLVAGVLGAAGWLVWPRDDDQSLAYTEVTNPTPTAVAPAPSATKSGLPRPKLGPSQAGSGSSPSPSPSAKRTVAAQEATSSKKGAGLATSFTGVGSALKDSKVSWYYNWAATNWGVSAPPGVQYVPMIWGADDVTDTNLAAVKKAGSTLLGFNEPNLDDQSAVSVDTALSLWPKLMATGMRLGSPSPSSGIATSGSWFDQFMQGVESKGYRVDFICVHWYGTNFTDPAAATATLKTYLQAIYTKYHKPIWLTEFALIDYHGTQKYPSQAQQVAFLRQASPMLQGLSYVERFAWFQFSPQTDGTEGTALYTDAGAATTVGSAYQTVR